MHGASSLHGFDCVHGKCGKVMKLNALLEREISGNDTILQ